MLACSDGQIKCKLFFFHTAGNVGPPVPCNIVKLVDVEEMEYFAKDGQGEVHFFFVIFV